MMVSFFFKKCRFALVFMLFCLSAKAQYAPPAGQEGSTAIHKDASEIQSWATQISVQRGWISLADTTYEHQGSCLASYGVPENALGAPDNLVVSLGDGGTATLYCQPQISNGTGPDFVIFENAFSATFLELAFVEVSSDGEHFVRFPAISLTQNEVQVDNFGKLDATKIHNLAGKYKATYGTPFDLQELNDSAGLDINRITHIRLRDVVGSVNPLWASYDSQGRIINDPFPTPFYTSGFDLDAVGIIHSRPNAIAGNSLSLKVYPNPVSDYLRIEQSAAEPFRLLVFDSHGVLQYTKECHQIQEVVPISDWPSGLYFLQIKQGEATLTRKISKL